MAIFKTEKLKKAETPVLVSPPLIEVIFELRWEIQMDQKTGRTHDPSYPFMIGRLYERLKKDFPFAEDLPSVQAHPDATPFVPRHRFRRAKDSYPLIQVGPGILTLNDSHGYSWTTFNSLVQRLVESIQELFPKDKMALNFLKSELRFVNAIKFDIAKENPLAFLGEKLHLKVEPDADLFAQNGISDRPNAVGLNLAYALDKPIGHLGISANLGQVDNKPAFIIQTVVHSAGETVPADMEGLNSWMQNAHETAETCFQVLCKGELMNRFCGV